MRLQINFIEKKARDYFTHRFPNASIKEREREIRDWILKVEKSRGVVNDFENRIGNPGGLQILDVGCGNGGVAIAFAEAGVNMIGVDIEKELIDIAEKHAELYKCSPSPKFILYDGKKLPFPNSSFDAATSISVLEHVTNPSNYLKEIWRVLKPGGKLYLAFPNRLWPKETHTGLLFITYLPRSISSWLVKLLNRNPLEDNNLHFYTFCDLKSLLNRSKEMDIGWKIEAEAGSSKNIFKVLIKKILNLFKIPHQAFLPHMMFILKKE